MKRRGLLRSVAAGWGLAGRAGGGAGGRSTVPAGEFRPDVRKRAANRQATDPVSVRSIAAWSDGEKPARRLFGNGPPFDDDRPEAYDRDSLAITLAEVEEDTGPAGGDRPDPPRSRVVSGRIDAGHLDLKMTYDGVRYFDSVDPTSWPVPDGETTLVGHPGRGDTAMYLANLFFADYNAYDLGMVNRTVDVDRTPDNTTLPDGYVDKGVVESHRWVEPADRGSGTTGETGAGTDEHRSLRNVVDRHREGVVHRLLWQNAELTPFRGSIDVRARIAHEWGARLGLGVFDLVGLCEVPQDDLLAVMQNQYAKAYADTDREYGKTSLHDLGVLVGERRSDQPADRRRVTHTESKAFDEAGPAFAGTNKEGWQRVVVAVPPLADGSDPPKFEVFVTHLQSVTAATGDTAKKYEDRKQQAKIAQLRTLEDEIRERRNEKPQYPKIVMGDFNVHSRGRGELLGDDSGIAPGQYFGSLMKKMHEVEMQDVWLTSGGPGPENRKCNHEFDGYTCDPFEPSDGQSRDDYYRGNRLDYVFVEKPRPAHELHLDVSRVKNVSWPSDTFGRLSDHPGVAFELLTSPAG